MSVNHRLAWESDLRKSIRNSFQAIWRVNGEHSGKTKILYVYQEGLGKDNKSTSLSLAIEWKKNNER